MLRGFASDGQAIPSQRADRWRRSADPRQLRRSLSLRRRGSTRRCPEGSTRTDGAAIMFRVPDDARIPADLEWVRAALERTQTVGRQLVGLNLHDANDLASQSGCQLRVVKRDGKGITVTADLATNRINIETEGDIVVAARPG